MIKTYPINKPFKINEIEFIIDQNGKYYSVWCKTDRKNLCTRALLNTVIKKIEDRLNNH